MPIEAVLQALVEYAGKKIADRVLTPGPTATPNFDPRAGLEAALALHLKKIAAWSEKIQFLRMPAPRDLRESTLALSFDLTPRQFKQTGTERKTWDESDLLCTNENLIILGLPGSGKTTTVKRLTQAMLTDESLYSADQSQVPLLIRLNSLSERMLVETPLLHAIAVELGLDAKIGAPETPKKLPELYVSGHDARTQIPEVLNSLSALVLLDGLDEVAEPLRKLVEKDISSLLESSSNFRVVVTCRTGDYNNPLGYMTVVEVCDLSDEEIEAIASKWLGGASASFLDTLATRSLREIANRPLFLTHMLALFDAGGALPEQPYELYELVTLLLIRDWDRERDISRTSRYGDFGPEKKLRFLAHVAFQLSYVLRVKSFTLLDLVGVYSNIRASYGLPPKEAEDVAREIQSHTGLIVRSGHKRYEFSHLTIQEYLAAHHLVRIPFPERHISALLATNPAPIAIATALSASPSSWLYGVISNKSFVNSSIIGGVYSFIARLEVESPSFAAGDALGSCILALIASSENFDSETETKILDYTKRLLHSKAISRSVLDLIAVNYAVEPTPNFQKHSLRLLDKSASSYTYASDPYTDIELPTHISLPSEWLLDLLDGGAYKIQSGRIRSPS